MRNAVPDFLPDGELVCLLKLSCKIEPANTISVKTQFAGPAVHQAVIRLLQHLKARYFSTFEMMDESSYWETGDEVLMHRKFKQLDFLINSVSAALQDFKAAAGEIPETLMERMERFLRRRLGG